MLKENFTDKFYTYHSKYIENVLVLRQPQRESLEIFARLCDVLTLSKEPDLDAELDAVHALCPTLSSFERNFPSFCFALATGIGKTRLMGACIAYLRYEKGIKNFFVIAPNLTIYNKLKSDLGNPSNSKYVCKYAKRRLGCYQPIYYCSTPCICIRNLNRTDYWERSSFAIW